MVRILIVEDDLTFSLMLSTWLGKKGFDVTSAANVKDAKQHLSDKDFELIISDLRLPDSDGIDLLQWVKVQNPLLPVIMMTSYADIQTAVKAMKLGASDYISKPVQPDLLLTKIHENLTNPVEAEEKQPEETGSYIEGKSQLARQMYEHVRLVAPTNMSVLINGSSGTGKEHIARRIHDLSKRSDAPFVAVDCGAIPKDLAASEFFGHIKGSFTGAIDNKVGAFEAAHGGTLFLDEIGNLSYEVQVQLLRALQERKIKPIGSNQEITIDVRLLSATNENLRSAIDKGDFREDLYHRINEFSIRIPDLRERKEDLMLFANNFLDVANAELSKSILGFDNETINLFQSYGWPGNLRQMKNVIRYATLLAKGKYITLNELPEEFKQNGHNQNLTHEPLRNEDHEKELILSALSQTSNNKSKAAQILGIDRKTLYNKIKYYNIEL
ncbi:MAG: sigma-54-dependent transcriptional regulator [Macellibacteroides sp.]|uniref:sigma-54-dependent transcriptional regulator n=1 Tax=Macellibacteroides sp. TaxID=2014584 RepID=UPI003E7A0D7D